MEKYLVKENLDIAQANILNIEESFVRPLSILANAIKDLGLEVTKENLFFNESRNNYNEMDSRLATLADEVDNKKIQAFNEALFPFKGSATIYNGMSVTAPELLCCIGIDENGSVYLLDSTKQEIIENAKEFCNTKAGKDLFDLHQKIAKELQVLYNGMNEIRKQPGHFLSFEAGYAMRYFPMGLFELHSNDDGDLQIEPRNINFDPVIEEDDDLESED